MRVKSKKEPLNVPEKASFSPVTIEEAENDGIYLANKLAIEQLRNGTASAQVITHFLKLGSPTARLEREIMEMQKEVLAAKAESLKAQIRAEEDYIKVINALRSYTGDDTDNVY